MRFLSIFIFTLGSGRQLFNFPSLLPSRNKRKSVRSASARMRTSGTALPAIPRARHAGGRRRRKKENVPVQGKKKLIILMGFFL